MEAPLKGCLAGCGRSVTGAPGGKQGYNMLGKLLSTYQGFPQKIKSCGYPKYLEIPSCFLSALELL